MSSIQAVLDALGMRLAVLPKPVVPQAVDEASYATAVENRLHEREMRHQNRMWHVYGVQETTGNEDQ